MYLHKADSGYALSSNHLPSGPLNLSAQLLHIQALLQDCFSSHAKGKLHHIWPVQIKLLPVQAPFFENANLLIAADCTAYAYAAFHRDFIKNHITLVGCPKLDEGDYTEKLTAIISQNNIKSLTIVRMEVPCCGGLERAATDALKASGKFLPWRIIVISRDGEILE